MLFTFIAATVIALSPQPADYPEPPAPNWSVGIEEDEPGWDCRTMGNQVCGPGAVVAGVPVEPGDYSANCWPGAIYCPPPSAPQDRTAV